MLSARDITEDNVAKPHKRKGSRFWWIAPVINGQQAHQSTKTEDYTEAREKLNSLEGKAADGIPITTRTNRALFRELAEDLKITRRKSVDPCPIWSGDSTNTSHL